MRLFFPVYTVLLALPVYFWAPAISTSPRKFILSRDCASMPTSIAGLEESRTKTLRIDDLESGAIIYSHDFESDSLTNTSSILLGQNYYAHYPLAFSCEVVVHAPLDNGRIMFTIESFFIPSSDQTCKDDFLYVFDSNTARSKAMPEAGGEQGLCLSHYPKIPVFSSKSYICIAFHTSSSPRSQVPKGEAMKPGFKIIVTAFQEGQTSACPEGRFHCGSVKNAAFGGIPSVINYSGGSAESRSSVRLLSMGICVSERVRCDGVFNCPDGRDEFPSLCNHFQDGGPVDQDTSFLGQFLSLGLTTSVSIVVAAVLFIVLCLGCIICLCCCRNRSNTRTTNSSTPVVNTVFNGVNRTCSGELVVPHTDPSSLLNGVRKSPDAFHSQILPPPTQQQQMVLPPAKSMGDLFHPHQLSPSSPMLRHFQEYPSSPRPPPPGSWNTQPICYSTPQHSQWFSQQQQQNQQHQQQVNQQLPLSSQKQASSRVSGATTMDVSSCPQQSQQQSHLLHSTRFPYQHPETSPLVADGGIVYLGEIGGGSGSGGSRLATGSRRLRRRSGRAMDTQSSSSIGCGPSTRGAQSAEGAPCTASNSSHSIGPSWSSSRGTTANNPSANSSANICPHHHHHHHRRRRRHGGSGGGSSGKQSTRNHSTNSSDKIAFPVEL